MSNPMITMIMPDRGHQIWCSCKTSRFFSNPPSSEVTSGNQRPTMPPKNAVEQNMPPEATPLACPWSMKFMVHGILSLPFEPFPSPKKHFHKTHKSGTTQLNILHLSFWKPFCLLHTLH